LEDPRIGWWFVAPRGALQPAAAALRDWLADAAQTDEPTSHATH